MTQLPSCITDAFLRQATLCEGMGSPFTATLNRLLADEITKGPLFDALAAWDGDAFADVIGLRLCAGLQAQAWQDPALAALFPPHPTDEAALRRALARLTGGDALLEWLPSAPQTNEVGRSAVLLGGYAHIAARFGLPLALHEIGASAGVNLFADQYYHDLGNGLSYGDPAAPVRLSCAWSGALPPLDTPIRITRRRGMDLAPLDARDPAQRTRMLAYIWADQPERRHRATAALETVAASNLHIEQGDAAAWLEALADTPPEPGEVRVIQHTVMWQYLPEATKARCTAAIERMARAASPDAPLAWLRLELDPALGASAVDLTTWPGTAQRLGTANFHGAYAHWADS
ncbi:MAG: DUF2332 domain-containing protein [Pseudomonadota bacterium]